MKAAAVIVAASLAYGGWAVGQALDPCGSPGQKEIRQMNRFSKPAGGTLDETKADLPLRDRLAAIDDANHHADQCRAVLGPIPKVNCLDGNLVPVTIDGAPITYHDGVIFKNGVATDWKEVRDCDRPAMLPFLFKAPPHPGAKGADPSEGCLPNVRLGRIRSGPVDWLFVCHYKQGLHEPKGDKFRFVAMIGSNSKTGETCFFAHDQGDFGKMELPIPGGTGPGDKAGREEAGKFWNNPAHNTCLRCHSANKPWALTPHLNQSRLEGDGSMEVVPETPRERRLHPQWGYRVIGVVHNWVFPRPKAIYPKGEGGGVDHTCTKCHVLTDQEEYLRLARESVGLGELPKYTERNKGFFLDRHQWMPTDKKNEKAAQEAVKRFERAFYDPGYRVKEAEILSPCPAPDDVKRGSIRIAAGDGTSEVKWTYKNDYGDVATRDDVRFRISLEGDDGSSCRFEDVAPAALGSGEWSFKHPAKPGVHYKYRVQAYRYCFDRDGLRDSKEAAVP